MQNPHQDSFLLEGLARQDSRIIDLIYKSNYKMVQTMVLKNKGSIDDAADIFQEGMIILYHKSLNKEFVLSCQLQTYLYSVCNRLWLKKLKKSNQINWEMDDIAQLKSVDIDMEDFQEKQTHFAIMEKAMGQIGEPCKSLLEAYYIHKKQMNEIATAFKYTNADNAKTQKYKCMMRLKKIFFSEIKSNK